MNIKSRIYNFFLKGHERSLLAKKNIFFSVLLKGCSIIIGLILIPMTIRYINPAQYGIWLTLSSIISWISFFDIGLGNGLKNKLAQSNALRQFHNSRVLVSTTYAILMIISLGLFLAFLLANQFINWDKILNTKSPSTDLGQLALIVFGFFCIQFVTQLINTILTATHRVARISFILLIGQIITLTAVYLLITFFQRSLVLLVLINAGIPVLVQLLAGFWYYRYDLRDLAPSFKLIDFKYARELLGLGSLFFIIQIGALVLFNTDNIVIVQLFGTSQVTTFSIAYRLFSVFILGFNIIITPMWSAFTDAYTRNDLTWIKSTMIKMRQLCIILSVCTIFLFCLSPLIYKIWLNDTISVPVSLSFAMCLYTIAYSWQSIHIYLLNGINKIRLQLYLVIISSLINIPLAVFLGHRIGLAGVTLSNAILFFIMGGLFSYQTSRLLNKTAKGILNA